MPRIAGALAADIAAVIDKARYEKPGQREDRRAAESSDERWARMALGRVLGSVGARAEAARTKARRLRRGCTRCSGAALRRRAVPIAHEMRRKVHGSC